MIRSIKPLAWGLAGAFMLAACDATELEENLVNPNEPNPEVASIEFVFNGLQLNFEDFLGGANEGPGDDLPGFTGRAVGAYERLMPLTRQLALQAGNRYDNAFQPVNFDFPWRKAYAEALPDAQLVKATARASGQEIAAGIALVYEAMTYLTLVDMFGDVPFSEFGQGITIQNPVADPGNVIYDAMLDSLDVAIAILSDESSTGEVSNDLIYGGSPEAWVAAANTIKLKALLNLRLVDEARATSGISAILESGEYINDMSLDWAFPYSDVRSSFDSRHTLYSNSYETGAAGYIGNSFMFDLLTDYDTRDPRLRYYVYRQDVDATDEDFFTLSCQALPAPAQYGPDQPFCTALPEEGYWGRDHGDDSGIPPDDLKRTIVGVYPAGGAFDDGSAQEIGDDQGAGGGRGAGILPVMLTPYVEFMRAEAALTLGTEDGDARALFLQAVESSIRSVHGYSANIVTIPDEFASVTSDGELSEQAASYLEDVGEAYDDAGNDDERLNLIGREYYKALWTNGLEAYNLYRRTGAPNDFQPTIEPVSGDFPRLLLYPNDAATLNSSIQQRDIAEQVFWDTNPAGFIN